MRNNNAGLVDHHGNLMAASDAAYDAASFESKELFDWNTGNQSADSALLGELDTIVARSNDLTRNNSISSGYSQTIVDKVVGPELRLAAKPNYLALGKDKEWASEWSRTTEAKFKVFANSTECDASRQQNFGGMTQLVMRTAIGAGEAVAVPLWLKGRTYRTAIMLVDPIRLSNPSDQMDSNKLRKGISTNLYGEAVKYHIRNGHPNDINGWSSDDNRWTSINSRSRRGRRGVIHVFDKKYNGQSRGEPFLASVMGELKMAGSYQKVQLRNAIASSLITAFIESSMSVDDIATSFDADYDSYLKERKQWKSSLTGGDVIQLPPGDKVNPFLPSGAADAFADFMDAAHRNIGVGLNMPREILMKDFSKSNYSNTRAAYAELWTFLVGRRAWLATHWAQPVYELWLEEAVMRGEVEAPDFYQNKQAYCASKWIGPGRGWLDVVKEAKGAELRMDSGISTQQDECAEQGKDYEEVQDQRASELTRAFKVAKASGLPESAAYRIAGFSSEADSANIESHFIPDDEAVTKKDNKNKAPKPK